MEPYVSRTDAIARMQELKDCFELEKRHASAAAVQGCMNILEKMVPRTVSFEADKAKRTVAVEPWYPGAATGRDVWRCGFCTTQVTRRDKYCSFCGRRLVDE